MWILYLAAVNLLGFALMGLDKYKARRGLWRIPEKVLFGAAILGGSPGCIAGMYLFRHKTKHFTFTFFMPVILILQLAAAAVVIFDIPSLFRS